MSIVMDYPFSLLGNETARASGAKQSKNSGVPYFSSHGCDGSSPATTDRKLGWCARALTIDRIRRNDNNDDRSYIISTLSPYFHGNLSLNGG